MENIEMNNINLEDTNGVVEAAKEAGDQVEKSGNGIGWAIGLAIGTFVAGGAILWHKTKGKREAKREARAIRRLMERGYTVLAPEPEDAEVYEDDVNENDD